ncbi:MAG: hypothetical protein R3234_10205 [Thermoanaerobaculia bacterium]|nr:hypothetical protein [Thermoanaerobaculia bacterium]
MTSGLVSLLVALALESTSAPGAVDEWIATAEELGAPLGFAEGLSEEVPVVWHDREEWSMAAFFQSGPEGRGTLLLYDPFFRRGLWFRPISDMPPDMTEYLLHALLEARLYRELRRDSEVGSGVRSRSNRMRSAPAEARIEAQVDALASFGSHLLSIYLEIARKERQRRAEGRSLCPHLNRGLPLFGLWERVFEKGDYSGRYSRASTGTDPGREVEYTRERLTDEDKRWLLEEILGVSWVGRAEEDLQSLVCGS